MLYYHKVDMSEGIDFAKSNNSKQCIFCEYCFFNHGFKYQDSVCNVCHDLLMQYVNISDFAIITVKGPDYCCIIYGISKSETINRLGNFVLDDLGYIRYNFDI